LEALKDANIAAQVRANISGDADDTWDERVRNKYFLAGGSCRFMFHWKDEAVIAVIDSAMRKCNNIELLLSQQQGARASGCVNTLLQTTQNGVFLLSEYVARQLGQKNAVSFILQARALCPNDSFDGWILEMDFLLKIKQEVGLTLYPEGEHQPIHWAKLHIQPFHDPENIAELKVSQWLVPDRWNQGGYDAVRVEITEGITVKFVQVTRAIEHKFKARFMNQMLHAIKLQNRKPIALVQFFFVVPRQRLDTFRLPTYVDHQWADKISVLAFDRTGID